jgi:hypothetical protein
MTQMPSAIKIFRSTDVGAPSFSGSVGSLIALLDACLVNGYGFKSGLSLSCSGTTVTATYTAHGYNQFDVVTIAGASDGAYNGQFKVASAGANTFTYELAAAPGTTAPTGTITAVKSAAGWTKQFSGTNVALYKMGAGGCDGQIRIDDTTTTYSTVRGYIGATDITPTTFQDQFPTVGQMALASFKWFKSDVASSAARPWCVMADSRFFYFFVAHNATYPNAFNNYAFGEFSSYRTSDAFNCLITGSNAPSATTYDTTSNQGSALLWTDGLNNNFYNCYVARSYTQLAGTSSQLGSYSAAYQANTFSFPNPTDLGVYLTIPYLGANSGIRGEPPGLYRSMNASNTGALPYTLWAGITNLPGLTLMNIPCVNTTSYSGTALWDLFLNVIGPWR